MIRGTDRDSVPESIYDEKKATQEIEFGENSSKNLDSLMIDQIHKKTIPTKESMMSLVPDRLKDRQDSQSETRQASVSDRKRFSGSDHHSGVGVHPYFTGPKPSTGNLASRNGEA